MDFVYKIKPANVFGAYEGSVALALPSHAGLWRNNAIKLIGKLPTFLINNRLGEES